MLIWQGKFELVKASALYGRIYAADYLNRNHMCIEKFYKNEGAQAFSLRDVVVLEPQPYDSIESISLIDDSNSFTLLFQIRSRLGKRSYSIRYIS